MTQLPGDLIAACVARVVGLERSARGPAATCHNGLQCLRYSGSPTNTKRGKALVEFSCHAMPDSIIRLYRVENSAMRGASLTVGGSHHLVAAPCWSQQWPSGSQGWSIRLAGRW